jgi:hypothetical protein
MASRGGVLFVGLLACLVALPGLVTAAPTGPPAGALADQARAVDDATLPQTDVEADTVSLRAAVRADGSASWRVTYRVELDDENATTAFENLQSDVEADPSPYVDRFRERMVRTASAAENATGREMAVENVTVSATQESLPQGEYGVLTYRLDWRGFATVEGGELRAGDAIDRFFLDGQTSLTVAWPENYGLVSVDPEATAVDEQSVTWQGRRDFGPGEPRVIVSQSAAGEEPTDGGGDQGDDTGLLFVLVGLLVVLGVALGAWWLLRGREESGGPAADTGDGGGDGDGSGTGAEAATPPPELLSNEERVLRLLEQQGGRIKQQEVAAELDWTAAKTSQVVSDLREADEVESFRLGRENVLTLPDVSIEADGEEGEGDA